MFRNKSNIAQHFDKAKLLVTEMTLVFVVGRGELEGNYFAYATRIRTTVPFKKMWDLTNE
jgi:hypothetical protein